MPEAEEYDFADVRLRLSSRRYSNVQDVSILVAPPGSKGFHCTNRTRDITCRIILLRKITDINEGVAICRFYLFIFFNF